MNFVSFHQCRTAIHPSIKNLEPLPYHSGSYPVRLSIRKQKTNCAAFCRPSLFLSLFQIYPKLENILSILAELAGHFKRRATKSKNSESITVLDFLTPSHQVSGSSSMHFL